MHPLKFTPERLREQKFAAVYVVRSAGYTLLTLAGITSNYKNEFCKIKTKLRKLLKLLKDNNNITLQICRSTLLYLRRLSFNSVMVADEHLRNNTRKSYFVST